MLPKRRRTERKEIFLVDLILDHVQLKIIIMDFFWNVKLRDCFNAHLNDVVSVSFQSLMSING
jgi:hypothetical protein